MKVKVFAKINLTLDVLGVQDGYHLINSVMSPINLYDEIIVKKRKDRLVTVKEEGFLSGASEKDNNAYKTAKLFMETFSVNGVDIVIKKGIYVGAGLGGSSADIAGVLIAMKRLYGIKESLLPIANKLGSDVAFMIYGKQAEVSGRGECVKFLKNKAKMQGVLIYSGESLSAKEVYSLYDKSEKALPCVTEKVVNKIENGDASFVLDLSNHLEGGVLEVCPKVKINLELLKSLGAVNAVMTGSGSAVYGIFSNKKTAITAYKKVKPVFKEKVKVIKTL